GRAQAPGYGGGDGGEYYSGGKEDRGRGAAASVCLADSPAGAGGFDGRVGVDAGSSVRGGVCDEEQQRCIPGGAGGIDWCGNLDGVRGGAVGGRIVNRARASSAARSSDGIDDGGGRNWTYASFLD